MGTAADKSWELKAAAVLEIAAGANSLIGAAALGLVGGVVRQTLRECVPASVPVIHSMPLPFFLGFTAFILLVAGLFAIAGGICALREEHSGLVVLGAAAAFIGALPLGLPAALLVILAEHRSRRVG